MRQETKLLKEYLHEEFPDNRFSIRVFKPHSYVESSDTIKIKTDAPYSEVVKKLCNVVRGTMIFPKGRMSFIPSYAPLTSNICGVENTMVEFIEIESTAKGNENV